MANPAIGSVSRWWQVTLTQSLVRPRMIARIADLRGHAFEPPTVCGLEHLSAVDLKAVTEQDVRFGDQRAKRGLPFEQWRFAHIVSV